MPDGTSTPPAGTADDTTTPQENWESRYIGLQKVVAKRDATLNTMTEELDALRAEHEATLNRLNEYTQRDVDVREEEAARQQYESLRERFEPAPPRPIGNNPIGRTREWFEADTDKTRKEIEVGTGW